MGESIDFHMKNLENETLNEFWMMGQLEPEIPKKNDGKNPWVSL